MGDNIKVVCRFRPLNQTELTMNKDCVADFIDGGRLKVKKVGCVHGGSE
jgi:hypothetical protein